MTGDAARQAWRTMQQLMFAGEGHNRMHEVCKANGISPNLIRALIHLSADEPRAMRDLADRWGCDASYVTALVDALEERGYAVRRPHPTDRRIKTVALTPEGAAARSQVLEGLGHPPPAFSTLSAEEQRQLRDLLRKVAAADQMLDPAPNERRP